MTQEFYKDQTFDIINDSQTIKDEQWARVARKEALREAFAGIIQLVVNTGKYTKVKAAMDIVAGLVDPQIHFDKSRVRQLPSTQDEPIFRRAADVATYKAQLAREEYLSEKFPELFFLLNQLNLALQTDQSDQLVNDLFKGVIFVGADINAFVLDPSTHKMQQSHKLERAYTQLPEEQYFALRENLYKTYVRPPSGQSRVVWEISMVTINGIIHDFTDLVEVIADPIDVELLEIYLQSALTNGAILKSNTHLELFELLCESGKIRTVAVLPKKLQDGKGYNFARVREAPEPKRLQAIQHSIISNSPVYVA